MKEKLYNLYNECLKELKGIGIDIYNSDIGKINITISNRNNKRYGCCKQEEPEKASKYYERIGNKKYLRYAKFNKHTIEISPWVMTLDESIIKNTIMHEIIHCFPYCNNHGNEFKRISALINEKLGYNISRVGNKKDDYQKSNVNFSDNIAFNYKIICQSCGQSFYRQRLCKFFTLKYRCGKCGGKLNVIFLKNT